MIKKTLTRFAVAGALGASLLAVSAPRAQGQRISFLREFNISGFDEARGVGVDATGVYVVGSGTAVGGGTQRAFLRKYGPGGSELWTRQLGETYPQTALVTADATGVYVVWGAFYVPAFVRKYDPAGTELWTRQLFSGPDSGRALGVAVDAVVEPPSSDAGLYVVGSKSGPEMAFVRKYDSSGKELWTRQSSPDPEAYHRAESVAADATGIYVVGGTGSLTKPVPPTGFLRKYTTRGDTLWTREFSGHWTDSTAVAADATGIYLVGHTANVPLLHKYDSNGNELWAREFAWFHLVSTPSPNHVSPQALAVDPTGVYLVGSTNVALPGSSRAGFEDAFVQKFDAAGAPLWTRQFSSSSDWASANGVAVDATGVYLAGEASGRALFAKFDPTPPAVEEPGPRILPGSVVNAANYVGGRISPGEIVTIFGNAIGPPEAASFHLTAERRIATTLAGTRLLFNGIAAPLLWVSKQQINAIVPYGVAENPTVDVTVDYQGARSNVVTMPVAASRPGIFTLDGSGSGHAAALNEDGSINSLSNPAERGSILVLYATGEGLTEPAVEDGLVLDTMLPKPKLAVRVWFCCYADQIWDAEVLYAGGAPDSITGLLQVNVRIPAGMHINQVGPKGGVYLELRVGEQSSGLGNYVFIRDVPREP